MGLIRLIGFCIFIICLIYFMTDFKIGGRTIKARLDDFVYSDKGNEIKSKTSQWLLEQINSEGEKALKAKLSPSADDKGLDKPASEQITDKDRQKLEQIIKSH